MTAPVTVLPDNPGDRVHSGYPRMLYRRGGDTKIHGVEAETCVVESPDEEASARADGWGSYGEAITGDAVAPAHDPDLLAAAELNADLEKERDSLLAENADLRRELADKTARLAAFDHDGDGNPGGRKKAKADV